VTVAKEEREKRDKMCLGLYFVLGFRMEVGEKLLHEFITQNSHTTRSCCCCCFCVLFSRAERRTQCWYSQYGPSSQRCTTSFIQEQNNGGYDEWEKNRPTEKRVPEPPEIKDEETETIRPTVAHIKSDHRAEV
jgi:hypothetical protein